MKKLFALLTVIALFAAIPMLVLAEEPAPRLVDKGGLLTESEKSALQSKLDALSNEHDYDIVVYTVDTLGKNSARLYAAEVFHYGKYGMGEDGESGVILLVSISDREWYIEFFGERRLTEGTALSEHFLDRLSSGDYYGAFDSFANAVDDELSFPFGTMLLIALIIGLVTALIVTTVMKGKLKSVAKQTNAREYVRKGSFKLTHSRDLYLYSTVTRVARPKNTSSGGSRSGGSRGGGGRF